MTITVSHTISIGHRLPSYEGICASPHGHNIKVVAEVRVGTDFTDFKKVKNSLVNILTPLDHAMILEMNDPLLPILRDQFKFRTFEMRGEPTTEYLAKYIAEWMLKEYTGLYSLTVHETDSYAATVRL